MTLKSDAKFDEKLTFNLESKMRLGFHYCYAVAEMA